MQESEQRRVRRVAERREVGGFERAPEIPVQGVQVRQQRHPARPVRWFPRVQQAGRGPEHRDRDGARPRGVPGVHPAVVANQRMNDHPSPAARRSAASGAGRAVRVRRGADQPGAGERAEPSRGLLPVAVAGAREHVQVEHRGGNHDTGRQAAEHPQQRPCRGWSCGGQGRERQLPRGRHDRAIVVAARLPRRALVQHPRVTGERGPWLLR